MKKLLLLSILVLFIFLVLPNNLEARSGCCSWHGGVCTYKCPDGVNVGYMCCDGTSLSAKCAPYYLSCPPISTPKCPSHSTYNPSSDSCECDYGYKLINGKCVKPEPIEEQPPTKEQSTEEPAIEEEPPAKEQSSEQPPASQRGLPAPEKLTAEVPKESSGGSIWWWVIGMGVIGYLFYVLGKRRREK